MNQGIFKLVFSKVLNTYVPVSEAVNSRGIKSARRRVRKHANAVMFSIVVVFFYQNDAFADSPAGLVPGTKAWVNAVMSNVTRNSMTIRQTAPKAILDWRRLNLLQGETLNFDQQGNRNWSALNRISDLSPSIIDGVVNAHGNVYFINSNGIIFGKNSQFNVGSIYAGTLDITDDLFNDGILSNPFKPVFEGVGGFVTVESGAQITTANGGKVLLFAPTVTNNGIITTPEGQTILAAGNKVYLQGSSDPAGFLVEVDSGGTATNLGKIVAERGNITMIGLAVNQSGTLSATTSVRANGSIRLLAQDKATERSGEAPIGARNGLVTLTKGSITEVRPEIENKEETIASQTFNSSKITIEASLINIDGTIQAKNGNVTANTIKNELTASPLLNSQVPNRIFLGENALIDVSGVDAVAPMSRNQLEIELFSDQLKDAPILRDSGLFKGTVFVDARKGTQLFDIKPFSDLKGATVAEKMTKAGTVNLISPTDIIESKNAVINVSGGSTTYTPGIVKETNLFYNGRLVPISEAKPGVPYNTINDVYVQTSKKWGTTRAWALGGSDNTTWGDYAKGNSIKALKTLVLGNFIDGYFKGDSAGEVDLTVPGDNVLTNNLVIAGRVLANTKVSKDQLKFGISIPHGGSFLASAKSLEIGKVAKSLPANFAFDQQLPDSENYQSIISTDLFSQGLNNVDFSKTEKLAVSSDIKLDPNGRLALRAIGENGTVDIKANIIAPSSNINLAGFVTVADGVTISTAGKFTNNSVGASGQFTQLAAIDGGNISAPNSIKLGKNITLDTSAGAEVKSKSGLEKSIDNQNNDSAVLQIGSNIKVIKGNAGNISLATPAKIDDSVNMQAYGFTKNGELKVAFLNRENPNLTLNLGGNFAASDLDIDQDLGAFSKNAFSAYDISAGNINIGSNSDPLQTLYVTQDNWVMNPLANNLPTTTNMFAVATPRQSPAAIRPATSVSFGGAELNGTVTLAENTTIRTDIGGTVRLAAGKQVNVLGDINTPSGNINIRINDKEVDIDNGPTQMVFIGEKANLSAAGTALTLPSSRPNLINSRVFNAGTISINNPAAALERQEGAVVIKNGAVLDVSGASIINDTRTATGFNRETLHGDAGTIQMTGVGSLLIDGDFKANATGTGRDGTLILTFDQKPYSDSELYPFGSGTFAITQQKQLAANTIFQGDAIKPDSTLPATVENTQNLKAQISAQQISEGGFANLKVKSFVFSNPEINKIELASGLNLKLAGNLQLESPQLIVKDDGVVNLSASHMTFKSEAFKVIDQPNTLNSVAGNGVLTAQAKQINIDGLIAVSGVKQTNLIAAQDIQGQGTQLATQAGIKPSQPKVAIPANEGGIVANGELNLTSTQIYPNTGGALGFEAQGADSKITINSSGVAAKPVLSAGGILSLKADEIAQNGLLTAPLGQINIDAKNKANFAAGSLTSVSANGQSIPYAKSITGGEVFNENISPLDKAISVQSKNVQLEKNAKLDLSAGGDMFAFEWVPGIGGSQDILAQPNTYAIMPNLGQNYAPFDQVYADSSAQIGVGQSVFLTGVNGLPTGNYTLLPARYALVPGALMVQANVANSNLLPGQSVPQLDGSSLTTGYRTELATGARDANWSSFKITDGAIFRPAQGAISKAPSQYLLTSATQFFSNPLKNGGRDISLPNDVARLSLNAQQLTLDSTILATKQAGGSGLSVDISAANMRVVSTQDNADTNSLQLTATSLNNLNADSILLGGNRSIDNGVTKIATNAETVSFESNANDVIKKPELIIAAKQNITVKSGVTIDTGSPATKPGKTLLEANGDGALFALSSSNDLNYSRTGSSANASTGELNIGAGSNLKAGNSIVLDATKSASLQGNVSLKDGGSATLGANRILLGEAPLNVSGLNVNAAAIAALGQLKALTLNSYNNIDTFGSVSFGNSQLDLTMNAAGIVGNLAAGETATPANPSASVITANTFTLKNTQDAQFSLPTDASGRALEINAKKVKFDGVEVASSNTQIAGFTKFEVKADEIRVAKQGEVNFNVAETTLTTGRLTADSGANYSLKTSDTLNINALNNAIIGTDKSVGAKLAIDAKELNVATNIDVASGSLSLTAQNDLYLNNGAYLTAAASPNTFYNLTEYAPAGNVSLKSVTANVNVNAGATIDVTSQGKANAGLVKVEAKAGTANIAGELKGGASGTGKGGRLDVDVKTLADSSGNLSTTDKQATGFSDSRQYRVRTGDVTIDGTGSNALKAREIQVSADVGKITVTGDIIATAPKNSKIGLYAGNGVTLESTANLQANSTKAGEEGGKVKIFTSANELNLKEGSSINVSGGTGAVNTGKVYLRAPRTGAGSGDNVAVNNLATNIVGAKSTVLEVFRVFDNVTSVATGSGTGPILGQTTIADDVAGFMANKDTILAGLGKTDDASFHLRAGTEVRSDTDLVISNNWDLYSTRNVDDEPSILTLRSAGNLTFNGSLSDGFTNATFAGATAGTVGVGESSSYRLIAGADASAANLMSTNKSPNANTGNVILAGNLTTDLTKNKGIRTGTGDIEMAAGGELRMGTGSTIYTAGVAAAELDGFTLPPSGLKPTYLTQGGDININVQGNIVGNEINASTKQLINQWLFRQAGGSQNRDASWWVRPDLFRQGTATLGGGDINISAGGSISNFSASAPTTARYDNFDRTEITTDDDGNTIRTIIKATPNQVINGGGDVSVEAHVDIINGVYFVAKGEGEISAGRNIKKDGTFGTILALQDGKFNVTAGKDNLIEAIINPTLVSQSTINATSFDTLGANAYFNSYSNAASLNVVSLNGNVQFGGGSDILASTGVLPSAVKETLKYAPSNLSFTAFNGDVALADIVIMPSPTGDLKVLAANNVKLSNLTMSDADLALLPNVNDPVVQGIVNIAVGSPGNGILGHDTKLLHRNNPEPNMIMAKNGDINTLNDIVGFIAVLPKTTKLVAGGDIKNISLVLQNNKVNDVSLIKAGQDITTGNITVAGPGELFIQAGRNIDLSNTQSDISTTGNSGNSNEIFASKATPNSALPAEGASITLQAGLGEGANVLAYVDQYILPTGAGPKLLATDSIKLSEYCTATNRAITDYMLADKVKVLITDKVETLLADGRNIKVLTPQEELAFAGVASDLFKEALPLFVNASFETKTIFANRHLTSELIASAKGFAKAGNHNRGNDAIATLFPTKNAGDILLFSSKISTNSSGSIDMLAPGGLINVGAPGRAFKDPLTNTGEIGIITEKGGAIRAIANGDFQVNQSKVITQFGSDIAIWSSTGTIDAGRGSKSATSIPERIVQTDVDGNTTIEVRGVAAGSGIRAQSYDPDGPNGPKKERKKGNVFLTAPRVDAGEAGIEAGDLFIVAPIVLNAANIQVQGASSGVPIAATAGFAGAGVSATPDAVNAATASVAQSVAQSVNQSTLRPVLPSLIYVDVISIGK